MGKKMRSMWQVLAVVAALGVVLAVAPAIGQEDNSSATEELHLHIGTDGKFFQHLAADGTEIEKQPLPDPVRCELQDVSGNLAALTANNQGVGIFDFSIGVKSTGAQGVPCGRVDGDDRLSLTLGSGLFADSAELDLELKGSAHVVIELSMNGTPVGETFEVISGINGSDEASVTLIPGSSIGSCRGAADSGPDSGSNDNCRVILEPGVTFNAVDLSVEQGEMSLEGSGDFGNDPAEDTIFHLVDWDGMLDCGQLVSDADGNVAGTIIRHDNIDANEVCVEKLYRLRAQEDDTELGDSVIFEFADPQEQDALYEAEIGFRYELPEDDDGNPLLLSGNLQYDPDLDGDGVYDAFVTMPACEIYPFEVDEDGEPVIEDGIKVPITDGDGNFPFGEVIPENHRGCVFFATQDLDGNTVWNAVFSGDWGFRPG